MRMLWAWLTGRSVPDLGDIDTGVQHRRLVRFDGRLYELANVERFPGSEHSAVKLTFLPGAPPLPNMSSRKFRRI